MGGQHEAGGGGGRKWVGREEGGNERRVRRVRRVGREEGRTA